MSCFDEFTDDEKDTFGSWYKYAVHWGYESNPRRNFEREIHGQTLYAAYTSVSDVVFRNAIRCKREGAVYKSDVYGKIQPSTTRIFLEVIDEIIDENDECYKLLNDFFATDLGNEFADEVAAQRLTDDNSRPFKIMVTCAKILVGIIFSRNKKRYLKNKIKVLNELYQEYLSEMS